MKFLLPQRTNCFATLFVGFRSRVCQSKTNKFLILRQVVQRVYLLPSATADEEWFNNAWAFWCWNAQIRETYFSYRAIWYKTWCKRFFWVIKCGWFNIIVSQTDNSSYHKNHYFIFKWQTSRFLSLCWLLCDDFVTTSHSPSHQNKPLIGPFWKEKKLRPFRPTTCGIHGHCSKRENLISLRDLFAEQSNNEN